MFACVCGSAWHTDREKGQAVPELGNWKALCCIWGLITAPNCPLRLPSIPWLARLIWEPCMPLWERSWGAGRLGEPGRKSCWRGVARPVLYRSWADRGTAGGWPGGSEGCSWLQACLLRPPPCWAACWGPGLAWPCCVAAAAVVAAAAAAVVVVPADADASDYSAALSAAGPASERWLSPGKTKSLGKLENRAQGRMQEVIRRTWFGTLGLRGRFIFDTPVIWFIIGWRFWSRHTHKWQKL